MADDRSSNHISGSSNEQDRNFSETINCRFLALYGVLIGLLGLKYNNTSTEASLFHTMCLPAVAFYTALFIYIVLLAVETKLQAAKAEHRQMMIRNFSFLSGTLAAILLVYMAIHVFGIVLLTFWAVWFVYVAYKSSVELYRLVYEREPEMNQRLPV